MPEYLIFFNQQWVPDYPEEDFVEIGVESKALVAEMKDATKSVLSPYCGSARSARTESSQSCMPARV